MGVDLKVGNGGGGLGSKERVGDNIIVGGWEILGSKERVGGV